MSKFVLIIPEKRIPFDDGSIIKQHAVLKNESGEIVYDAELPLDAVIDCGAQKHSQSEYEHLQRYSL